MPNEAGLKIILRNLDMFVWTSGFQNPLAHTHFNMFVDEWMSANESPVAFQSNANHPLAESMGYIKFEGM